MRVLGQSFFRPIVAQVQLRSSGLSFLRGKLQPDDLIHCKDTNYHDSKDREYEAHKQYGKCDTQGCSLQYYVLLLCEPMQYK